ncbi:DUF4336 domain-containing protein [Sulfitobacter sp. S190]|uniref:DUF4336 domain-containing protein n=1 Tax=Sulfitobacter sp. S190 TaxID=2867022 RepID=UPI0021A30BF2|nr:DUF4336 domain-containing protein [Sulfitobacter sp. S190]UWR21245.1 DUF4336 domain-containing protein [Sulfitobacter sp. S190]
MLQPFGSDLWLCDGPTVTGAAGFRFPTRMVVIRLPDDGGLWVWSPVAVSQELRAEIDALGPVRHLIAPNNLHYTFLAEWAAAYPLARVHAAPGLSETVAGTSIHHRLGNVPDPEWSDALDQVLVPGNRITTEIVFFHRDSSTVIVTDWVQQIPSGWFRGWRALVARLDLMTAASPSVPRKFRLATTDKTAARKAVQYILEWEPERLVFAHGAPRATDGLQTLRNAFQWLLR